MTVPFHRFFVLAAAVLSAAALSACGVQHSGTADVAPMAGYADAGAGGSIARTTDAQVAGGSGRATYEGNATGSYSVGDPSLAYRYFGAHVRLTADFRDNYIWGTITDGRDTDTLPRR